MIAFLSLAIISGAQFNFNILCETLTLQVFTEH